MRTFERNYEVSTVAITERVHLEGLRLLDHIFVGLLMTTRLKCQINLRFASLSVCLSKYQITSLQYERRGQSA
jgi:hypothetical protein